MTELKTSIESFHNQLDQAEESVNFKIDHLKLIKGTKKKSERNPWNLGEIIKWTNIFIMGVPEGVERKKEEKP